MSVADVMSSVQQMQSRIAELQALFQPPAAVQQQAAGATGAAAFGDALSDASGDATSATGEVTGATGAVTGSDVVADAEKYLGVPYVLGGESKQGIDCSGLVQKVYGDLGVDVPRLVHQQQTIGTEVKSLKDARPGDLVVLNGGDHIAIWAGDGKVIHAPYEGRTVSLQKAWFTDADVVTIRRVVPSGVSGLGSSLATGAGTLGAAAGQSTSLAALLGAGGATTATSSSTTQHLIAARAALLSGGSL